MSTQHPVNTAESRRLPSILKRSIPRRQVLKIGATGAVLSALSPLLAAQALARQPEGLPDYAPVPASALGPALNTLGYHVGRVARNLYWVTDGTYQAAFLTTSDGVVLFDAPPTIGHNLQRAIDEIANANGVSNKVAYLVYSHHHADHAGASSLFGKDVVRIGHEETRRLMLRDGDPARPAPSETFADRRTLKIGGERIELAWHGSNHTPDNTFIHFPEHHALMLVDIVNAGWVPIYLANLSEDIPGYVAAPATALTYPLEDPHQRPRWPAWHARRRSAAPAVHGGPRLEHPGRASVGRPHAVLREVRRELLGRGEGLPGCGRGRRGRAGDCEVHGHPGGGRRLHAERRLLADGVDPARPRLCVLRAPVTEAPASTGRRRLVPSEP